MYRYVFVMDIGSKFFLFRRRLVYRKANRKSQKWSPFSIMGANKPNVSIPLNWLVYLKLTFYLEIDSVSRVSLYWPRQVKRCIRICGQGRHISADMCLPCTHMHTIGQAHINSHIRTFNSVFKTYILSSN